MQKLQSNIKAEEFKKRRKMFFYFSVLLIAVPLVAVKFMDKHKTLNKQVAGAEYIKLHAIDIAKKVVSNNLKAPSTARFQDDDALLYNNTKGNIVISGFVDSENSFSALLRSDWKINLTFLGYSMDDLEDKDKWVVGNISIKER